MEGEKERNIQMREETLQGRVKMVKDRMKSAKKKNAREKRGWLVIV